jgi:hypothetical protein
MHLLGVFLRTFRNLVEHPEEDLVRPSSRYLPEPDEQFWGEDQQVSPPVLGEDDQYPQRH